ncbi:UDP-N-acetylmuramoyl-tripeptide--D-alanyl-D-alanine ligase [Halobacillus amylolyticus]|uniref:UDP-N-acetylmuramoyl-tripeptide--D-alanyl-D-alanine ligase n=1 Tax=Halobacillus amylolyticus TaxID=2932259 RepID=A0ABY4HDF3_9BACI|nr:UDP-N-acetylmuramoyl-tripeptide--D-alanyl-D-alanine ligase [Halobacillus amylolyticus]UOR12925.1 UDP-N-acetylmuramoyl-tripeptide--D-alanyl-D-alanine ligase [Halobacillus amylolyticus]
MFTVKELTKVFPEYRGAANDSILIRGMMTDTRKEVKQSLFVPIVGESFDAHQFLTEAIKQGAVAALWQKGRSLPEAVPTEFPVLFVDDTTAALQQTAKFYLDKVAPTVIGVTGSNGKTTTKDLTASILQVKYKTHKTAGNYNNHIGLPLTILAMPLDTEVAVLEMGMNKLGEISLLSKLAQPDHVMITNIGESHIEYLGSRENIARAKLEILDGWSKRGLFVFDGDEPLLTSLVSGSSSVSCGFSEGASKPIQHIEMTDDDSSFKLDNVPYHIPMSGRHNIKNASYVIAIATSLGLTAEEINRGFNHLEMSGMRFEKHKGKQGALIINDAYNASPTSMKAVIEVVCHLKDKKNKVLVLGDMFELGDHAADLHASVASAITEQIHTVYTIGEHAGMIIKALKATHPEIESKHFQTKQSLSDQLQDKLTSETVVLLKASRGMKLEEIMNDLTN